MWTTFLEADILCFLSWFLLVNADSRPYPNRLHSSVVKCLVRRVLMVTSVWFHWRKNFQCGHEVSNEERYLFVLTNVPTFCVGWTKSVNSSFESPLHVFGFFKQNHRNYCFFQHLPNEMRLLLNLLHNWNLISKLGWLLHDFMGYDVMTIVCCHNAGFSMCFVAKLCILLRINHYNHSISLKSKSSNGHAPLVTLSSPGVIKRNNCKSFCLNLSSIWSTNWSSPLICLIMP